MRTKRTAGLIGAFALVAALSVGGLAVADNASQNGVQQSLEVEVNPFKKLPKKGKGKGVDLTVAVGVRDINATPQKPPAAEKVDIKLSKDLKFNTKGLARCNEDVISTLNTNDAKKACQKAVVGSGSASATCTANTNPGDIPDVAVTAFNGQPKGKKPVLLLHTVATLGGTDQIQILPGVLNKGSGVFGKILKVEVPPLAGGACSIVDFVTEVGTKFKHKGKRKNYIAATCKDKKMEFGSNFEYVQPNAQGVTSLDPSDDVRCTQKN